ncbi:ATP-binding protein [Rhodobacteraceae bacterium D3-12]|nr:ATP-binding protein [Rhodobacteraceae bacterium D3-12]
MYGLNDVPESQQRDVYFSLLHPDDREALNAGMQKGLEGDRSVTSDIGRVYKTSGELMTVKRVWRIGGGADGRRTDGFGLHIDLTDFEKLNQAHDEALERLKLATEGFPGLVYQGIWKPGQVVKHLYLSERSEEYWGVTPQQVYDDPQLLDAEDLDKDVDAAVALMLESARSGAALYRRLEIKTGVADFHGAVTDLGDGTYRIDGVVVDVTAEVAALKEAQHQAVIANRAQRMESIGHLTGGIAHDFNNLLAVIMGNLELLYESETDPLRRGQIEAGLEASRRGADLTRSMLAFAREAPLKPEVLDLNAVVRSAQHWMQRALPETVEVETSLLAGLWRTELDASSLERCLLNLLLNARDAMDGTGKLTIETTNARIDELYVDQRDHELEPGRYVMLAVSDTGCGIAPEALHHIFDPFYTTKETGKGSGMGLPMIEGFVKQSNGSVQVYTEPGEGTTIKLYFPAVTGAVAEMPRAQAGEAERASHGQHILLVEDEEQVRKVLAASLRRAGYRVTPAESGDQVLEIFQNAEGFDLLVTDIVMPGVLQGTTLAKAIRGLTPELPMIFMSGYATEATVHGNGLRPEDIRLMKPVPRADFLMAVARALAS